MMFDSKVSSEEANAIILKGHLWDDDKNSIKFSILRRIALQVLPCQSISGDLERTTSKGSLMFTKHRNQLKGKAVSDLVSAASLRATQEHTTRKKRTAVEHFDTFISSMITFAKSDDYSKFNEYLSSLLPIDSDRVHDATTDSGSESDDSDDEEADL